MSKGKSHSRGRCNILKANERMQRKKTREQAKAKSYDKQAYDKPAGEES
jgi:hypothetical protein